jgi:CRP-like cAMP-binding protein
MTSRRSVTDRGVSPILLANCPHLADLGTKSLVKLSRLATSRLVCQGEEIYRQGQEAESVFILLDGAIELDRVNEDRTRSRYDVVAPQATFGDVILLGEAARRYTATAQIDSLVVELPLMPLVEILSVNTPQALAWRSAVLARLHRKEPGQVADFGWKLLEKLSRVFEAA